MEQALGYTIGQPVRGKAENGADGGLALLAIWYQRHRQRLQLRQLDDHLLADIGLSREQAVAEARKPFWAV